LVAFRQLTQADLDIVREQEPNTADLILQRQSFRLELDPVFARNPGSHVEVGGGLRIGMTELEDNLGIAGKEALVVANPSAKD